MIEINSAKPGTALIKLKNQCSLKNYGAPETRGYKLPVARIANGDTRVVADCACLRTTEEAVDVTGGEFFNAPIDQSSRAPSSSTHRFLRWGPLLSDTLKITNRELLMDESDAK